MEAILKFQLPEEAEAFELCCTASNYQATLQKFDLYLEKMEEYYQNELSALITELREKLYSTAHNNDITIYK
jgi:hypothetical protein